MLPAYFLIERETKGALRYMEVTGEASSEPFTTAEGADIGTLYIRKSAFNGNAPPKRLIVTVTPGCE